MGPPDNSLQAQTISSCIELLSCDPCCENVQGLPNPVDCSRGVLHLVDFISRNMLMQNMLLQLLPGKSSPWGLSAWGWLSDNFVGGLWSLIDDNGCSWRKTLLKSAVSVTGERKVSVLMEGLNVVIMYRAVQSCLHVYNKIPYVFWKKIQRKYITAALKNHNGKVVLCVLRLWGDAFWHSCCPCVQQAGTYLPQSYLIHEQMIVTDRIENVDQLGFFIYRLCRGKETYKLQRKEAMKGKCSFVVGESSLPLEFNK